ncbi:MAG: serine hydrolase [Proteobacteria bacterium]|nr:serine hydrolase [Pseudomonadota bacterium]
MPRSVPKLAAAVVGVLLVLLLLSVLGPPLWTRYLAALSHRSGVLYQPRSRVTGGNQPAAPRVLPGTELLDLHALEEAAAYAGAHGAQALIVSRHDHIVFERYWRGTSFATLIDAGSFTPLLVALATGHAISHRQIGWLEEPIGVVLHQWADDPRGAITVRNLLQSSSGLAPAGPQDERFDLAAALLARPLVAPPGMHRVSQPTDPQLMALVLERATRERYADYVSQSIWRPIGAADAWLWLDRPGGSAHADCCMISRQGDWIRVGELLLRDGNYRGDELMRPGWVAQMRSPSRSDPDFGMFVRLAPARIPGRESYATRDLFVAGGDDGNLLWVVPSMGIVILRTGRATADEPDWDDARIPNLVVRGARDYLPPAALPGSDLSSIVPGH